MKFYNDTEPLYLETDASGVGLGAALLQLHDNTTCQKDRASDNAVLHPVTFAGKSLTGADQRYSNIEREVLGLLHALEKFQHYCFSREVLVITDHKPLVYMFKKDITTLSQVYSAYCLKFINIGSRLYINLRPKIFIADWLSQHNHVEGKNKPIKDMDIKIDAIWISTDIPECVSMSQIQLASAQDDHLQCLKCFIITG